MTNDRRYPSGGKRGKRGPKIEQWRGVGSFGTIGFEIVLCIAFGFFGGRWIDEKFATAPYGEGIGFFFGLAAAINSVMRAHREMQALAAKEEREHGNPRPIYDARDDERKNAAIQNDYASESNDHDDQESGKADR
jgi:F0F1-type ATP synthase assembly protein I